ncbi:MAG: TrmH family RNA methyltransferase, partial [Acidobacteriota bacterium]
NEGNGIGPELMEQSDQQIRIPLSPPVESLNVAAAAAVLLFEGARQRRDLLRSAVH